MIRKKYSFISDKKPLTVTITYEDDHIPEGTWHGKAKLQWGPEVPTDMWGKSAAVRPIINLLCQKVNGKGIVRSNHPDELFFRENDPAANANIVDTVMATLKATIVELESTQQDARPLFNAAKANAIAPASGPSDPNPEGATVSRQSPLVGTDPDSELPLAEPIDELESPPAEEATVRAANPLKNIDPRKNRPV